MIISIFVCKFAVTYSVYIQENIIMIASSRIYPEKRKGVEKNVPLQLHIFFDKKRVSVFNTGFRCDLLQWDTEKQQMKRNNVNKAGQTSTTVNLKLNAIRGTVDTWAATNPTGTIEDLLKELRTVAGKKEKIEVNKDLSFEGIFKKYVSSANFSERRKNKMLTTLKKLQNYKADVTFTDFKAQFLIDYRNFLTAKGGLNKDTANGELRRLRAFCNSATAKSYFSVYPFADITLEEETYGTPVYITIEERNKLFDAVIENDRLARVRDLFIVQSYIGCRIADYLKLKKEDLKKGGFIEYIAGKTKEGKPITLRIPLKEKVISVIKKYDFPDGKLMPFITDQKYNDYLKELFALEEVGLTRNVTILNKHTKQPEVVPLNTIASTHMARKTFVGSLYKKTKNEIIASMSGHKANSKAFERYYNIDDNDKINAIDQI